MAWGVPTGLSAPNPASDGDQEQAHGSSMRRIPRRRAMIYRLSRILVHLGLLEEALPLAGGLPASTYKEKREHNVAPEWVEWVERWFTTTTRPPILRRNMRLDLLRLGRWLVHYHPEVTTPAGFTRELAAEIVAAVNQATQPIRLCLQRSGSIFMT